MNARRRLPGPTTHRGSAVQHPSSDPPWSMRAMLTVVGSVALLVGLWGLLQPTELASRVDSLFGDPYPRRVLALVIWGALLALATVNTAGWAALSPVQFVGAWVVVGVLWLAGMLLLHLSPIGYEQLVAPIVRNPAALRTVALLAVGGGVVLEVAALVPSDRPADHGRPPSSVIRSPGHPRAA